MKNYDYSRTTVTKKKIAGYYDAERHVIATDEAEFDLLDEMSAFNGAPVVLQVNVKTEEDLSE